MKALILNSGMGTRMGILTSEHPKCMTEVSNRETILSRQLNMLAKAGIDDVIITTGYFDGILVNYCQSLEYLFILCLSKIQNMIIQIIFIPYIVQGII